MAVWAGSASIIDAGLHGLGVIRQMDPYAKILNAYSGFLVQTATTTLTPAVILATTQTSFPHQRHLNSTWIVYLLIAGEGSYQQSQTIKYELRRAPEDRHYGKILASNNDNNISQQPTPTCPDSLSCARDRPAILQCESS